MSKALEAGSLPEVRKRHFETEGAFRSGNEEFLKGVKGTDEGDGLQLDLGAFLVGEPTQWIEDNVVLVNSQKHGKYSFADVPYFREVVRDFFRPESAGASYQEFRSSGEDPAHCVAHGVFDLS